MSHRVINLHARQVYLIESKTKVTFKFYVIYSLGFAIHEVKKNNQNATSFFFENWKFQKQPSFFLSRLSNTDSQITDISHKLGSVGCYHVLSLLRYVNYFNHRCFAEEYMLF